MTIPIKGMAAVKQRLVEQQVRLQTKVLRGAARAGADVIAAEAKARAPSDEVSNDIEVKVTIDGKRVVATISVKPGWARSLARWAEYGTSPHFISVDDSQRAGRSVGRINKLTKEGDKSANLVIGGNPVGGTVYHPGAQEGPFMRPALDHSGDEARAAAQRYVLTNLKRGGDDE